jgi:transcriptional regulator with XRE-family HTH domain
LGESADRGEIAAALLAARESAGVSRGELARALAVSSKTIRNWERGYTRIPLSAVPTIRRALGMDGGFEPFGSGAMTSGRA